jgi:hypothetical protein
MSEHELAHARRPAEVDWGDLTERDYKDVNTGADLDSKLTVSQEQAASDLARARSEERAAREAQSNADLADALSQLDAKDQGQQPADQQPQDQQPAALDEPQPDAPQMTAEEAQRLYTEADRELETALQNPLLREKLETEFNAVREEGKAEAARAHVLAAGVKAHYDNAVNNLAAESRAVVSVLFPELEGMQSQEQITGALRAMAQTPQGAQRVQQLQALATRAAGIMEAQARQQYEQQQGQALQQNHALEQFTAAEEKRFEEATKHESPETMKRVRSQVYDVTEKAYGINKQTLNALYSGQQRVDSAAFVRSAAFQLMLTDAVKYRLSRQGITQARSNPVQKVQRPGVAADGPRVHEGDLAAAASRFNLPGGNEGREGIKNAAAWLSAKRGRG